MTKRTKNRYNLSLRPKSYWEHTDPLQAILSGISGRARREMITDFWNAGKFDQLEPGNLEDELDEGSRQRLGAVHPFFMGGEYLPKRLPGEVTIITIHLESTTFDVIELRVRPLPDGKISLRWVDEYESAFHGYPEIIDRPFSFKELMAFIEATELEQQGCLPGVYTEMNMNVLGWSLQSVEELRYFSSYSSDFYPQVGDWAQEIIDQYLDQGIEDLGLDEEEELDEEEDPCSAENS